MNELALTEPLQPENLGVGLEGGRLHFATLEPGSDDVTGDVFGQVLVQGVVIVLQVLGGLAQTKGIEPVVSDQAPIQPLRSFGSRVPQWAIRGHRLGGLLRRRFLTAEPEPGLDPAGAGVDVGKASSHE